jgi:alkane 1-monooxygenase
MKIQDLKYLLSFSIPIACYFSIVNNGLWSWATLIYAFMVIPSIELLVAYNNQSQQAHIYTTEREHSIYFDLILYANLPLVYYLLYLGFSTLHTSQLSNADIMGKLLSLGVLLGACGINVAHELGHKQNGAAQITAKLLLIPSLYTHFTLQHNRGHHLNVGTPQDPATAKKGEILYLFWWKSTVNSYRQAWQLEKTRLQRLQKSAFSLYNEMYLNAVLILIYLLAIALIYSPYIALIAVAIGITSFLLLETINYIEHYGLSRKLMDNGKYEKVEIFHSWNSDHVIGRIVLYELTLHADHHYKANKKYQMLLHYDASPQLPFGYPASLLLSLVPPLWFKIMNPLLDKFNAGSPMYESVPNL